MAIVESEKMWTDFESSLREDKLQDNTVKTYTSVTAALLLYKSAQGSEAVAGATLKEFRSVTYTYRWCKGTQS